MDELELNIEKYEELFGVGHNDPQHLFNDDGIDSLFNMKRTGDDSNCQDAYAAEVLFKSLLICLYTPYLSYLCLYMFHTLHVSCFRVPFQFLLLSLSSSHSLLKHSKKNNTADSTCLYVN